MIAALLFLAAGPAAPAGCDASANQTQLNACAQRGYEAADDAMNTQWKRTTAFMQDADRRLRRRADRRPGYGDTLLAAQRAWLTFRELHCRGEGYTARGGTMEPLLVANCLAELTRARTAQLKILTETGN